MFYTSKVHIIKSFEKKNIIRTQMFKLKIYIVEIFFYYIDSRSQTLVSMTINAL